jgi:hypothetical protein
LGEPFQDATQLADVEVCSDQPEAVGQPGVERALELLRIELRAIMQQVGAPTIKHLGAGHWC